jgi:RNA 2',3'-cyclic 3'-phosphodiesterase
MIEAHLRQERRGARNLYVMVKPPAEVAEQIAAHPRAWRGRGAELLHMTVQPIIDLSILTADLARRVRETIAELCATVDASAFQATMDRIVDTGRTVKLRAGRALPGADAFHAAIRRALTRDGFPLMSYSFTPHVTLAYRPDGLGNEAVEPVRWLVEEIRLIESVVGERRHIEHGRWRLAAQQGELFR